MSVNYGNGIETGKKVFNEKEQEVFKKAKDKYNYLTKVNEELTVLNKDFDELITKTRSLCVNNEGKINNQLTASLMKVIQDARDKCISELKEVLLDSE